MSLPVLLLVLAGALLHAAWNVIVKGGSDKLFEIGMNALGAGIGAAFFLPFLPFPDRSAWLLLFLSTFFHFIYYLCMVAAYRVADLSLGYTIMRGTAPVLTALALFLAGVPLPLAGWLGILLLCSGIFALVFQQRKQGSIAGVFLSLRTSLAIMAYTLADGYGARLAGDSLSYTGWIFFFNIFPIQFYILGSRAREYRAYLRKRARIGVPGGFAGLASYGIAIWAMTVAPIALVAALRETSVVFGMILAVIFLGEKLTILRVAAVVLVVAGAMLARLG